jgi:hypothetical protein
MNTKKNPVWIGGQIGMAKTEFQTLRNVSGCALGPGDCALEPVVSPEHLAIRRDERWLAEDFQPLRLCCLRTKLVLDVGRARRRHDLLGIDFQHRQDGKDCLGLIDAAAFGELGAIDRAAKILDPNSRACRPLQTGERHARGQESGLRKQVRAPKRQLELAADTMRMVAGYE